MSKTRTAGDGMESIEKIQESLQTLRRGTHPLEGSLPMKSTLLQEQLIQVHPTNLTKPEKNYNQMHPKTPKFVPYEPYTAAVKPILPQISAKGTKKSKNNMDINTLISQMAQMSTNLNEFKPRAKLILNNEKPEIFVENSNIENTEMKNKISEMMLENKSLSDQLSQQVQVNKELKTMLVASMGEDLEVQVQSLNEDKKHLANALLSSAQHLSTHQEQTEWLAGQCEVWRSKFLASSLMVEELANWKKELSERCERLQHVIKQLLEERCRARDMMLCTYKNLYSLHENWLEDLTISGYVGNSKIFNRPIGNLNLSATLPHSTNILDLASVNLKLSGNISSTIQKQDISQLNSLPTVTEGEKQAEVIMAMPMEVKKVNDAPLNALVHHAYYNSSNTIRPVASCVHCNGRVQLL